MDEENYLMPRGKLSAKVNGVGGDKEAEAMEGVEMENGKGAAMCLYTPVIEEEEEGDEEPGSPQHPYVNGEVNGGVNGRVDAAAREYANDESANLKPLAGRTHLRTTPPPTKRRRPMKFRNGVTPKAPHESATDESRPSSYINPIAPGEGVLPAHQAETAI